jgi:hypothetical protein
MFQFLTTFCLAICVIFANAEEVPSPKICYVLPTDFKGLFRIKVDEGSSVKPIVVDRLTVVNIPRNRNCILQNFTAIEGWHSFVAFYSDGKSIPIRSGGNDQISFLNLLYSDNDTYYYFLGNELEFKEVHDAHFQVIDEILDKASAEIEK